MRSDFHNISWGNLEQFAAVFLGSIRGIVVQLPRFLGANRGKVNLSIFSNQHLGRSPIIWYLDDLGNNFSRVNIKSSNSWGDVKLYLSIFLGSNWVKFNFLILLATWGKLKHRRKFLGRTWDEAEFIKFFPRVSLGFVRVLSGPLGARTLSGLFRIAERGEGRSYTLSCLFKM